MYAGCGSEHTLGQSDLSLASVLYPECQERRGTMALAWFPGALFTQGTLLGLAQLLSEWHGWLVSKRAAEWHWALFPLKCLA